MKKFILLSIIFISLSGNLLANGIKKQRIVSLAPATTEILFALGLDEEIVGVSNFCDYPKEALTKDKVGTFSEPSIEKIVSLKPDLILSTGLEQAPTVEKLKQLKLNVYVSDPANINALLLSIENIGKLTNKINEAQTLINQMRAKIDTIKNLTTKIPENKKPKIFIEIWHTPLMTAGKGSFIDELITLAAGINIAHDTLRPYSYFSPEQVIERNPDYIILGYMDKNKTNANFSARLGWNTINAVKNNQICADINPDLFLRPGPRIIEGLEKIYQYIHKND